MPINPNIVLAGQQPNFLGIIGESNRLAGAQQDRQRQNQLQQLYQQQGPGIVAGDPGALNQLAQFDPQAALGIQASQAQQARLSSQEQRAIETHALRMSEFERDQEQRQIQQGLMRANQAYAAGDLGTINQILGEAGEAPIGSLQEYPALASRYEGVLESLERVRSFGAPPKPADEYGRYAQEERAAGREPLGRIDFHKAKQRQSQVQVGPDGTVRVIEGPGAAGAKFTEAQSKDNVYSTRARGALEVLEPVAGALTSRVERIAEGVPLGIGRELQSDEFQVAQQAGLEFLQAILRKDTGAAITQSEEESYGRTYLPQPGDGPAKLEAKREARIRAVNAIEAGMSPQQLLARDRALINAAEEAGEPGVAAQAEEISEQLQEIPDFTQMSDEELDAYIAERSGQ